MLVVYPEAYQGMWNDARLGTQAPARELGLDDVEYLSTLVDGLRRQYDVPADRVFAAGFSNGGQMVIRLVLAVPVLLVSGTKDPIVPFEGGVPSLFGVKPRGPVMSSLDSARHFAARNGITREPVTEQVTTGRLATTVTRWREDGHEPVDFCAVEGWRSHHPQPRPPGADDPGAHGTQPGTAAMARDFFGLGA